ncbi:PhoB family transcriptional regulator [Cephaloticoccus primus]|uniref:PhoB family transcriptional regulator n=1 Tax=Cephaloticoccus primus TaxID=1548207 RepID=A0A139SRI2_9BACT|nr:PhoB family transcriptional regulator [Cephaloticoccus primus]
MRLLVVEDDEVTARGLATGLTQAGFEVRTARRGDDALRSLDAQLPELVVLDWMLPGADGMEILRGLRGRGTRVPVLLLTARDALEDRVEALDAGADDYLAKPFAFAELLARVRALLRRAVPAEPWRRSLADLELNFETRLVTRGGQLLELTPREFDFLAYLIARTGEVVSRDELARQVWRENNRATPLDNVIDVHAARLRRKLDEGRAHKLLHTVRGVGFVLREESPGAKGISAR